MKKNWVSTYVIKIPGDLHAELKHITVDARCDEDTHRQTLNDTMVFGLRHYVESVKKNAEIK